MTGQGPRLDAVGDFGGFEGRAWLNCAHQGPLPRVAIAAAERALADKAAAHRIGDEALTEVPRRLKQALGRLVGVPADQVILGNSTSYGLHLLVQGVPWREGLPAGASASLPHLYNTEADVDRALEVLTGAWLTSRPERSGGGVAG